MFNNRSYLLGQCFSVGPPPACETTLLNKGVVIWKFVEATSASYKRYRKNMSSCTCIHIYGFETTVEQLAHLTRNQWRLWYADLIAGLAGTLNTTPLQRCRDPDWEWRSGCESDGVKLPKSKLAGSLAGRDFSLAVSASPLCWTSLVLVKLVCRTGLASFDANSFWFVARMAWEAKGETFLHCLAALYWLTS